jgi:hypothetical protein
MKVRETSVTQILIEASEAWPATDNSGKNAYVSFDGEVSCAVTITDPFTRKEEQLLAWYFEEHPHFPLLKQVQATDNDRQNLSFSR